MIVTFGACAKCLQKITNDDKALTCHDCTRPFHGSCFNVHLEFLDPGSELIKAWRCPDCRDPTRRTIHPLTDVEAAKMLTKLRTIGNLNRVFEKVEFAISELSRKAEKLEAYRVHLQSENIQLRKRIYFSEMDPNYLINLNKDYKSLLKNNQYTVEELRAKAKKNRRVYLSKKQYMLVEINSSAWIFQLVVLILISLYTILGALIFWQLEGRPEQKLVNEIMKEREDSINRVFEISKVDGDERIMRRSIELAVSRYAEVVTDKMLVDVKILLKGDNIKWNFAGSTYFSATTYSTLGYGDLTPLTQIGKLLTMIYAMIGIPIFVIFLGTVAGVSNRCFSSFFSQMAKCCRKCWKRKKGGQSSMPSDRESTSVPVSQVRTPSPRTRLKSSVGHVLYSPEQQKYEIPVWLITIILSLYILVGSALFTFAMKKWSYWESFYFINITFLSVGFGDYTPDRSWTMLFTSGYFVIGLSLTTMLIQKLIINIMEYVLIARDKLRDALLARGYDV